MKKLKQLNWFWIIYAILIILVFLLASCATTHPADMKYHDSLKTERLHKINIKQCEL